MASKSLGTLTIDLVAKTGGFVSGMDKAEKASSKWRKQVQEDARVTSASLAAIGVAAVAAGTAVGAAGFNLLKTTAQQITETDRWAKSLKISTQELLAWQFAAERAGVAGDNMADIFKDLSDKIGDAVLNKSGEAVDALNALGLSAEKLSKVSPDVQMLAIGEALGKISTNAGKITILESLGNDLSKLLPLFDNNNQKLQDFIRIAKDYGVAPDPSSIDDLIKVNDLFLDMEAQVKGLKMEIAGGLAKVDLSPLQDSLDKLRDVLTDPQVLQGIANLVSEVAKLAGWLVKAAASAGDLAVSTGNRMAALGGNVDLSNIDQVNERIDYLKKNLVGRDDIYSKGTSFFGWLSGGDDSVKTLNEELTNLIATREKLSKQKLPALPLAPATTNPKGFKLNNNETNSKTTPDAGGKKLENAYKAMEQSYQRQIALIDTTGKKTVEVTALQKLQFDLADGKLVDINATQKTRLEQLATEVDRLNALKKANAENIKLMEYVSNLQISNENAAASLNADVVGAGMGDKTRDRMRERLEIQRDFLEQQRELERQFQSGDIDNKDLYDKKTAALKSALDERLAMQEDHYKKVDALEGNWLAGAQDGLANWVDTSSDYYSQVSGIVGNTLDGMVDNMADALNGNKGDWTSWANSVLSDLQKVLLKAWLVNSMKSASDSGIFGSLGSMFGSAGGSGTTASGGTFGSGVWDSAASGVTLNAKGGVYESADLSKFSGSIVNSPTMFAFAKGAGLMGEAGPEAIMPLTRAGDGSLGVRMVGETSVGGGASPQQPIIQHISVSGNGDAALTQAMQQAARQGAQDGRKMARQDLLEDFATRGQARRMLNV